MTALLSRAAALLVAAHHLSSAQSVMVGDEVCITNYIMDTYCIEDTGGYLLDDPDTMTLVNPEKHSYHCLLDVDPCWQSGYVVLTDKNEGTGMHCLGYRLEDTQAVRTAGFAAGGPDGGYCKGCTGDESDPTMGFRATIRGTVKELGDGTRGVSGTPLLENIQVLPDTEVCETTVVDPVCMDMPDEKEPEPALVPSPVDPDPSPAQDCTTSMCDYQLSDDYALKYQINVPAETTDEVCEGCTISMELTYDGKAWVGIAFSLDDKMAGSEYVIGIPGEVPMKYFLLQGPGQPQPMAEVEQTLTDASCEVVDGKTVMKFTKIMKEPGEIEITTGENNMLWAYGSSTTFGYHGANKSPFVLDFGLSPELMVGDEVCITNYIMDRYCIEDTGGYFLDDPGTMTLKNPEEHSFHCLLDVDRCWQSGYVVLTDKNKDTGMHCLGYRLEDTQAVRAAGFAAGGPDGGYCKGCTGDESAPTKGYRATVKGIVKELGDGSNGVSGTPLLENTQVLPDTEVCETTTVVDPVCMDMPEEKEPEPAPVPAPVDPAPSPAQDCTSKMCEYPLTGDYLLRYQINVPSETTEVECEGCTISMELTYDGEAWVGIAFSLDALMAGSEYVIGFPGEVPLKYFLLDGRQPQPMAEAEQTLMEASCELVDGQTVMKFTKLMKEPGEIEITTGDNKFLYAHGESTTFGYHGSNRAPIQLNLSSGAAGEASLPNKSAWLAHGIMAFLAWGVFVPFAVESSLLRDLLPKGPIWFNLHRAFNTTAFALSVALFAVAVAYTNKEGSDHFENSHEKMGLAMFIAATLQVLGGALRPHLPAPDSDEEKTGVRKGWEVGHRLLGVALLACGFWQMQEGIELYSIKFLVSESDKDKMTIAYWVWIGVMSAIILIGGGYFKLRSKDADDSNAGAPQPEDAEAQQEPGLVMGDAKKPKEGDE